MKVLSKFGLESQLSFAMSWRQNGLTGGGCVLAPESSAYEVPVEFRLVEELSFAYSTC